MKWITMVALVVLAGCGGGGGSSTPAVSDTPTISNFKVTPSTAIYQQNSGSIPVTITFDCSDAQNNINTFYVATYYSNNVLYSSTNGALSCVNGHASITGTGDTSFKDTFSVKLYAADSQSNISNQLTATYTVQ